MCVDLPAGLLRVVCVGVRSMAMYVQCVVSSQIVSLASMHYLSSSLPIQKKGFVSIPEKRSQQKCI